MKQHFVATFTAIAAISLSSGCLTPKYDKIPLERSEIPYILADGDYVDVNGNLHENQHNVWAMQEADVYDYVRGLVPARSKRGFMEGIRKLKEIDHRTLLIGILIAVCTFLGIKLAFGRRKNEQHQSTEPIHEEDEEDL